MPDDNKHYHAKRSIAVFSVVILLVGMLTPRPFVVGVCIYGVFQIAYYTWRTKTEVKG